MKFKTMLSAAFMLAFMSPAAIAQTPSVNYGAPAQLQSYRAAFTALTPAASATDFFTIAGSASVQVRIRTLHCDATNTSGSQSVPLTVVKRSTLDTGGASTTPTAIALNTSNSAALATIKAYTSNPTLGTLTGTYAEGLMSTTPASPAFNNSGVTFDFSNQNAFINSATGQIAVNANAVTWNNATSVNCFVEWTEQ